MEKMQHRIVKHVTVHDDNSTHQKGVIEYVDCKPNINNVIWFAVDGNGEPVPHVTDEQLAIRSHNGAMNEEFRQIQYALFKNYFDLTDQDQCPYRNAYTSQRTN